MRHESSQLDRNSGQFRLKFRAQVSIQEETPLQYPWRGPPRTLEKLMKIGNSPEGSASPAVAEQRPAARKAEPTAGTEVARPAPAPQASTQVAISSAAKLAASAAGGEDGSFDAAKVDRIAKAISEGKFTVNANAIADKLVANAQELLNARANKH